MPWDVRWSASGDIEFNPNMDLGIIAGHNLIQQRIMVRLRMTRGWIYDRSGVLGSRLNLALAQPVSDGVDSIPGLILEALDPMANEISVDDITIKEDERDPRTLLAIIVYHLLNTQGAPTPQTVTFPLS